MTISERVLNACLADMHAIGGKADTIVLGKTGALFARRYVLSGVLATREKKANAKRVKTARRRNRGRGAFARFR